MSEEKTSTEMNASPDQEEADYEWDRNAKHPDTTDEMEEEMTFPGSDVRPSEENSDSPFGSSSHRQPDLNLMGMGIMDEPGIPLDTDFDPDTIYSSRRPSDTTRQIHILTGVIGDGNGGMSNYAVNLFKALPESLVSVTFLSTSEHPFFEKEIKEHYGQIRVIPSRKKHPFAHKKAIQKILEDEHFDACHIHLSTASNIEPIKCAVNAGIPVVISHIHSAGAEGGMIAQILHKISAPKLSKLPIIHLACSDKAGKFGYPAGEYVVAPNAVDITRFYWDEGRRSRFRSYYGIPENAFVLGHIGRFVSVKNQNFILPVFKALLDKNPDACLLLCGDGPMLEEVKAKVKEMGLEDKVFFPGNIINPQDAYCAMDLFILPSLFEGFPLTVVEAYASGLSILVSDKVTQEVKLSDEIDFFSLDIKPDELADKILSMSVPAERRESRGKELAVQGFDWGTQAARMMELYKGGNPKELFKK